MTRDEIVTALRCCSTDSCDGCPRDAYPFDDGCIRIIVAAAADMIEKLEADRKALINELCQYCGKYKQAHEGACDGCRWREM